jgi:carboxypeptidase Taq
LRGLGIEQTLDISNLGVGDCARHPQALCLFSIDRNTSACKSASLITALSHVVSRRSICPAPLRSIDSETDFGDALFSTLHEAGHAMYEQGIRAALDGTPLGRGVSAGIHESQSWLWENVVGRSRGFWQHFYPSLQRIFAEQLSSVPLTAFHHAINKVARSLIRTDADEVTYNLHIMLRFNLELRLLEGELRVQDLPEAWRAAMQADLGIAPSDDRDGCLQDVHWYSGSIGGRFQSYAIGNILSAQFYAAALKGHPDIPQEIASGEFGTLHTWLHNNLYRHGSKFVPNDLVKRATGKAMTIRPYLGYLREKYGTLYRLPASA